MPKYGAKPACYTVMQDSKPGKSKGEAYTSRMGNYDSLDEAKKAIAENERELRHPNTYGGLIDWGPLDMWHRSYRIFKAEYTEIK